MTTVSVPTATMHRIMAIARRDLRLEASYHFQMALRVVGISFSVASFFFLGELVGEDALLDRFEGGYFAFALVGLILMLYAQVAVLTAGKSFADAQGDDTLEVLLASPTSLSTLVIGTFVTPLVLVGFEAAAFVVLAWLFSGFVPSLAGILLAAPVIVLTVGTFCALGTFGATVIVLTKRGDPFSGFALQATNLLAGVLFPVALLPDVLQTLARAVPAFYGLRALRTILLTGGWFNDIAGDMLVLLAFNLVLGPTSVWALSRALRFARITGTLGNR